MSANMGVHMDLNSDSSDQQDNSQNAQHKMKQFGLKHLSWMVANPVTRTLVIVLVVQLALAVVLLASDRLFSQTGTDAEIFTINAVAVDTITIDDVNNSITVSLTDVGWELPGDLPANEIKVKEIINKLDGLVPGLPVATSQASHGQLDVSKSKYQRRVQLKAGTKSVADLYIGSSPGFRKAHIRQADSDAVFVLPINAFELPTSENDWLDKDVLSFTNITRIDGSDFSLEKSIDDKWALLDEKTPDSGNLNSDEVNELVATLEGLQVTGIASNQEAPELNIYKADSSNSDSVEPAGTNSVLSNSDADPTTNNKPTTNSSSTVTLNVTHNQGADNLTLYKIGDDYAVLRSDRSTRFSILPNVFDTISGITKSTLMNISTEDPNP